MNKNLCILWMLIVPINIYCCELVVGGALACMNITQQRTMGYRVTINFVHPPPTCKPMSNVTFTTWGHPYGELTHVKIRHLLTYHMTLLQARFVHTARQCKMSRLATEIVHLAIYTRPYCGLIFLPIIRMNVVLNRTVTVTWDTNTLLECTRCSKARNVTQTHH